MMADVLVAERIPTDSSPAFRIGHKVVSTESDMFLFGGYRTNYHHNNNNHSTADNNSESALLELFRYNFASGQWKVVRTENIPSTCIWSSLHLDGTRLYVYGGTGFPTGEMLSNNLKVLDLNCLYKEKQLIGQGSKEVRKPSWSLIETCPSDYNCLDSGDNAPPRGYKQTMVVHCGSIYLYSGISDSEFISDMHKLNFKMMSWEILTPTGLPPKPPIKYLGKDTERFYVAEHIGDSQRSMSHICGYLFDHNRWETINILPDFTFGSPEYRLAFGVSQSGSDVIISGGAFKNGLLQNDAFVYDSAGCDKNYKFFDDLWKLDLKSFQWRRLTLRLPFQVCQHCTIMSPSGYLYVSGGIRKSNKMGSNNSVIKIRLNFLLPKLSELCWEKIIQMLNKSFDVNRESVEELGIPWTFLKRLH